MTWTGYYDLVAKCPKCKSENNIAEDLDFQITCEDCSKEWETNPNEFFLEKQIDIECGDCGSFALNSDDIKELENSETGFINVKCPDCEKTIKVTKEDFELESEDEEETEDEEESKEEPVKAKLKGKLFNYDIGARRRGMIR